MLLKIHQHRWFFTVFSKILSYLSSLFGALQKVCKSCRCWQILQNENLLVKVGFDTAVSEPSKSWQTSAGDLIILSTSSARPLRPGAPAGQPGEQIGGLAHANSFQCVVLMTDVISEGRYPRSPKSTKIHDTLLFFPRVRFKEFLRRDWGCSADFFLRVGASFK